MSSSTTFPRLALLGLLVGLAGAACSGPSQGAATSSPTATATGPEAQPSVAGAASESAPAALPAEIRAHVHLPGPQPEDHLFVTVSLDGLPWTITGCVTASHGACEETMRVELTEADRQALVAAIAEVRAIPRCEPEGIFPGDRAYRLDLTGAPRPYEGHLPADVAEVERRGEGPCRADARLAWWIARRFGAR